MVSQSFELTVSVSAAASGQSSLLIPALQMGYFQSRCASLGGRANYLSIMVRDYLPYISEFRSKLRMYREPNWNTAYQRKGQDLQKKNLIPSGSDWECFRQAAGACGVSICFLFVFLMHLEGDGFFEKIRKKGPVVGNSIPEIEILEKKLGKFSKFERVLEGEPQRVRRRLYI